MTVYDWRNTWWELRAVPPELAIVPVGTTEPHGPHLPLATTNLVLDVIARRVAEELSEVVYLLPVWPLGSNPQHAHMPGALSLSWRTLMASVTDLVEALHASGIRRVALLVGLGSAAGNTASASENEIVKTTVRRLNYEHPELTAIWLQPLTVATPPLGEIFKGAEDEVRAGVAVTSLMLRLYPEWVRPERTDYIPQEDPEGGSARSAYLRAVPFEALCPQGVWGHPSQASPILGERILRAAVAGSAAYIQETLDQLARLKSGPRDAISRQEDRGGKP
jgi:creatinine amidohydrolase